MTINVRVVSNTPIIKTGFNFRPIIKTAVVSGQVMARNLNDLLDVDVSGVNDKYVIMYDASTKKYTAVNPDDVLSASSTTETIQPGLPENFVDTLDVDLDDRIDLDGGTF
jgi:hypothetical protein